MFIFCSNPETNFGIIKAATSLAEAWLWLCFWHYSSHISLQAALPLYGAVLLMPHKHQMAAWKIKIALARQGSLSTSWYEIVFYERFQMNCISKKDPMKHFWTIPPMIKFVRCTIEHA